MTAARCRAPSWCASATMMRAISTSAWRARKAKRAAGWWCSKASIRCWATARRWPISSKSRRSTASSCWSTRRIPSACSGRNGRGLADEAGLEDEVDFVVGTFSKSIGAIGGFGAGNHPLFDTLRYASRPYMFTASPSPATVATSLAAVRKLAAEPERRDRLSAIPAGCSTASRRWASSSAATAVSPVIAVKCADEVSTIAMWNALLEAGVYVNIALPPARPDRLCLLRCSVRRRIRSMISTGSLRCLEKSSRAGGGLANSAFAQHIRKQRQASNEGMLLCHGERMIFSPECRSIFQAR